MSLLLQKIRWAWPASKKGAGLQPYLAFVLLHRVLTMNIITRGAWAATGIVVCWFVCYPRCAWAATGIVVCWSVCYPRRVGGHGYSSLLVCYPRRAWAATGIVVCWSVCYPRRVGGHGYSSLLVCLFVTRGARGRPRV